MPDPQAPVHQSPPVIDPPAVQDTARYLDWMARRGTPVQDTAREDTRLRIGDWGFFDHGSGPGMFADRAGLDRAGHVIVPAESGHWFAFFTTPGVDAAAALARVAWLFRAIPHAPLSGQPKITAPTLTVTTGQAVFQGWLSHPPAVGLMIRLTITATPAGTTFVNQSARQL